MEITGVLNTDDAVAMDRQDSVFEENVAMATTQQLPTIAPLRIRGRNSTSAVLIPSTTSATIPLAVRRSYTNPSSRLASNSESRGSVFLMNDLVAGHNRRSSLAANTFNSVNDRPNDEVPYMTYLRNTGIFSSLDSSSDPSLYHHILLNRQFEDMPERPPAQVPDSLSTDTVLPAHTSPNRRSTLLDVPERPHTPVPVSFSTEYFRPAPTPPNRRHTTLDMPERSRTWFPIFPAETSLPTQTLLNRRHTALGLPERPESWLPNSPSVESIARPQYLNYVPATEIDWTLPSTRLHEYQEIDRSSKGVRGLWRRYAPRWFHKNSRQGFFVEGQDDTSSVRRHRVDLTNQNENVDVGTGSVPVREKIHRLLKNKIKRTFGRFTSRSSSANA